jgi:hypothetical protein
MKGDVRNAFKTLLGNPQDTKQHGRPKRRIEADIKMGS